MVDDECECLMKKTPSIVYLHEGALGKFARIIEECSARRILFVVDDAAYIACGAEATLEPALRLRAVSRFSGFELNPKIKDVEHGIEQARGHEPELVIALGGGTAIDLAKLIASLSVQQNSARDIVQGQAKICQAGPPLIAIPTTSGTGSEATHFAVVYIDDDKHSVAHESLLPHYAIVDPCLTYSLPPAITAATGLDAFCQSIESIWAVGATDQSIAFATQAARHAIEHLVPATRTPTPEARLGMSRASHLAGKAINISKTTAPHALSYSITSRHHIPHGIAVALTLSRLLAYNAGVTDGDCVDPRGAEHVRRRVQVIVELILAPIAKAGITPNVAAACERIQDLLAEIGCPNSLAQVGINQPEQLQPIINSVNTERMSNNPRGTSPEALLALLREN